MKQKLCVRLPQSTRQGLKNLADHGKQAQSRVLENALIALFATPLEHKKADQPTSFYVRAEVVARLKDLSRESGVPVDALVRKALDIFLLTSSIPSATLFI